MYDILVKVPPPPHETYLTLTCTYYGTLNSVVSNHFFLSGTDNT